MKHSLFIFAAIVCAGILPVRSADQLPTNAPAKSGNPGFPGWYADPEGVVFGEQFWVYPTYSARMTSSCSSTRSPRRTSSRGPSMPVSSTRTP